MLDTSFTIGIIGHRHLGGSDVDLYVQLCCHKILSSLRSKYPKIRAISAIAQGADSIFTQTAVSLNIQLESVIPFDDFRYDFTGEVSHERYTALRKRSNLETRLNFLKRSSMAYKKSMEWIVFKSNIVIAVWDGKNVGSPGGTWEAVLLCEKLHKTMINIDAGSRSIHIHFGEGKDFFAYKIMSAEHIARCI